MEPNHGATVETAAMEQNKRSQHSRTRAQRVAASTGRQSPGRKFTRRRFTELGNFCHRALIGVGLLAVSAQLLAADCNLNGIEDSDDLREGNRVDCNQNGQLDSCERPAVQAQLLSTLPGSEIATSVFVDDFSGDGTADLGVGAGSSFTVWVSQGGTLLKDPVEHSLSVDEKSRTWRRGDLDGDGDIDLATVQGTTVLTFLNDGAATFSPGVPVVFQHTIFWLALSDVNGDGLADPIVSHSAEGTVSIALRRADGTFEEPLSFAVGDLPGALAHSDLDGDGDEDVAVVNRRSLDISILENDPDGVLRPGEPLALGIPRPERVLLEDLNGDDLPEVIVVHRAAVVVAQNLGARSFGEPRVSHLPRERLPNAPRLADLDGDADLDLVIASVAEALPGLDILWNLGDGDFGALTVVDTNLLPPSLALTDVDGDGDVDWIVGSVTAPGVHILANLEGDESPGVAFRPPERYFLGFRPHAADRGDVDGDGDLDFVTGNNQIGGAVTVLRNHGDGTFGEADPYDPGGHALAVTTADINNDGEPDIVVGNPSGPPLQILWNVGNGKFDQVTTVPSFTPWHVTAADLDGEGGDDVVVASGGVGIVTVMRNFEGEDFTQRESITVGPGPSSLVIVDLDLDGDLDIATSLQADSGAAVLLNDGAANFGEVRKTPLVDSPSFLTAGDFDADGFTDLAFSATSEPTATVLWNVGDATFAGRTVHDAHLASNSIEAGDLNGDGLADLALGQPLGDTVTLLVSAGERVFRAPVTRPVGGGFSPRFVFVGDFDQSGTVDVATTNHGSNDVTVFLNDATPSAGATHLDRLCSVADFYEVSLATAAGSRFQRMTEFLVPAREEPDLLRTLFQNANRFPVQEDFLRSTFGARFENLTTETYQALVAARATRSYYSGVLTRLRREDEFVYAFDVRTDESRDPEEVLAQDEVRWVHDRLTEVVALGPLAYRPTSVLAHREAAKWDTAPFPVLLEEPPAEPPNEDGTPTFALEVPTATTVCAVFARERVGRELREEYELKSTVRFTPGTLALPTDQDSFAADLVSEVLVGPEEQRAEADGSGILHVIRIPTADEQTVYRFNYAQTFRLPSGETFGLRLINLDFTGRGDEALSPPRHFAEPFLSVGLSLEGSLNDEPLMRYASCNYAPLPRWEVDVELEDGSRVRLEERFEPSENLLDSGPAALVRAEVEFEGQHQVVTDYWRLVYTARRHNRNVRYWVILEPPMVLAALASPVGAIEVVATEPFDGTEPSLRFLDENLEPLGEARISRFTKEQVETPRDVPFRRGDVNADGNTTVVDPLHLIDFLFGRSTAPRCEKSADIDDSGRLNLVDVVRLVTYLFRRGEAPHPPFDRCASDPTPDELDCTGFEPCE